MIYIWHDWLWLISYLEFLVLNSIKNLGRLSSFIIDLWCPNVYFCCVYNKITSSRPSEGFFAKKIQGSVVPRSIMTNMNYFEYQYGQRSNMPKFNYEKHDICLVSKVSCISCNEQQLFQASNVPRSLMTNMNNFEYQ
jgi:hypothetical protein